MADKPKPPKPEPPKQDPKPSLWQKIVDWVKDNENPWTRWY